MSRRKQNRPYHYRRRRFGIVLLLLLIGISIFRYTRPLPALTSVSVLKPSTVQAANITWPAADEAAIGAVGDGVLARNGAQTALPTASVAKLITALTVLKKYPLAAGQQGPTITMTAADVALYNSYVNEQGSVVQVEAGEQLTEYQMLVGMLLPSANNLADSLAIWAYGSLGAYNTAATNYIQTLGLTGTTIGSDASGFLPATVSTAHDLVVLGETTLANPVLKDIVAQSQASFPVVGTVYNVNSLLGQDGIIGIKTGNTDQAGGVYVFAANDTAGSQTVTIVGAITGATNLATALSDGKALLDSAKQNFVLTTIIAANQPVAHYKAAWSSTLVDAVISKTVTAFVWRGSLPATSLSGLRTVAFPAPRGVQVGTLTISQNSSQQTAPVMLEQKIPAPPWWWRIIRHNF